MLLNALIYLLVGVVANLLTVIIMWTVIRSKQFRKLIKKHRKNNMIKKIKKIFKR